MPETLPLHVINRWFKGAHIPCRHLHPGTTWEWETIKRFFILLKNSSKFYGVIHLLPVILFKLKKLSKDPWKVIKSYLYGLFWSWMFLTTYMTLLKYGSCFFKNLFHNNRPLNIILAAAWTFPGLFWETDGRRTEMSLYFLSPFFEGVQLWLDKRGLWIPIKHGEVYLFMVTMAIIMYCYQTERDSIKSLYKSLFEKIWGEN